MRVEWGRDEFVRRRRRRRRRKKGREIPLESLVKDNSIGFESRRKSRWEGEWRETDRGVRQTEKGDRQTDRQKRETDRARDTERAREVD